MSSTTWAEIGERLERCVEIRVNKYPDGWLASITLPDMSYGYGTKSQPTLLSAIKVALDDSEMTEAFRQAAIGAEQGKPCPTTNPK